MAELGTLAPTGFFTPGDVKNEALLLRNATLALARLIFNHIELFNDDFLLGWNAFVADEKEFYARAQAFTYWIDFADNASRDQVLALERRYSEWLGRVNEVIAGRIAAEDADDLETFSDPATRQPTDLFPLTAQAGREAKGAVANVLDDIKSLGWDVVVAGVVVAALVVAGVIVLVKSAGLKAGPAGVSVGG